MGPLKLFIDIACCRVLSKSDLDAVIKTVLSEIVDTAPIIVIFIHRFCQVMRDLETKKVYIVETLETDWGVFPVGSKITVLSRRKRGKF